MSSQTNLGGGAAYGDAVDFQGGLADADRYTLPGLAAGAGNKARETSCRHRQLLSHAESSTSSLARDRLWKYFRFHAKTSDSIYDVFQ